MYDSESSSAVNKRKLEGGESPRRSKRLKAKQASSEHFQNGSSSQEKIDNPKVTVVVDAIEEVKKILANSKNFHGFDRNRTAEIIQQIGRQISSFSSVTDKNVDIIHAQLKTLLDMNAVIKADFSMFSSNNAFADELARVCSNFDLKWEFAVKQYEKQPKPKNEGETAGKLKEKYEQKIQELEELNEKYKEEIDKTKDQYEQRIEEMEQKHSTAIALVEEDWQRKLERSLADTLKRAEKSMQDQKRDSDERFSTLEQKFEMLMKAVNGGQQFSTGTSAKSARDNQSRKNIHELDEDESGLFIPTSTSNDSNDRRIEMYFPEQRLKLLDAYATLQKDKASKLCKDNIYSSAINEFVASVLCNLEKEEMSDLVDEFKNTNPNFKTFVTDVLDTPHVKQTLSNADKQLVTLLRQWKNNQPIVKDNCSITKSRVMTRLQMNEATPYVNNHVQGKIYRELLKAIDDERMSIPNDVKQAIQSQQQSVQQVRVQSHASHS